MATTVNLKVEAKATVEGAQKDLLLSKAIANVTKVDPEYHENVTDTETVLFDFTSGLTQDFDLVIIVNRGDNFITVGRKISAGREVYEKAFPGIPVIFGAKSIDANAAGSGFSAFADLEQITVKAETTETQSIEVYLAKV